MSDSLFPWYQHPRISEVPYPHSTVAWSLPTHERAQLFSNERHTTGSNQTFGEISKNSVKVGKVEMAGSSDLIAPRNREFIRLDYGLHYVAYLVLRDLREDDFHYY